VIKRENDTAQNYVVTVGKREYAVPGRMRALPRDPRGYPVPFVVLIEDGLPRFALNAHEKQAACLRRDLCSICGQRLLRGRWFVQGPGSALHADGAYIDAPTHGECVEFALKVCPYLAASKYMRMVAAAQAAEVPDRTFVNPTTDNTRPDYFVAVMATAQHCNRFGHFVPHRPYTRLQIWRQGVKLLDGGPAVAQRVQAAYDAAGVIRPPLEALLAKETAG
jgi:hypothetical protein